MKFGKMEISFDSKSDENDIDLISEENGKSPFLKRHHSITSLNFDKVLRKINFNYDFK